MNVFLKIKKSNLDLIKAGTKKTEWRDASEYNMKRLFKPREIDGKLDGNLDVKTITFVNGYSKDSEKIKTEVKKITLVRFSKFTEIPEDNFTAQEGQFSIEILLGSIIND